MKFDLNNEVTEINNYAEKMLDTIIVLNMVNSGQYHY